MKSAHCTYTAAYQLSLLTVDGHKRMGPHPNLRHPFELSRFTHNYNTYIVSKHRVQCDSLCAIFPFGLTRVRIRHHNTADIVIHLARTMSVQLAPPTRHSRSGYLFECIFVVSVYLRLYFLLSTTTLRPPAHFRRIAKRFKFGTHKLQCAHIFHHAHAMFADSIRQSGFSCSVCVCTLCAMCTRWNVHARRRTENTTNTRTSPILKIIYVFRCHRISNCLLGKCLLHTIACPNTQTPHIIIQTSCVPLYFTRLLLFREKIRMWTLLFERIHSVRANGVGAYERATLQIYSAVASAAIAFCLCFAFTPSLSLSLSRLLFITTMCGHQKPVRYPSSLVRCIPFPNRTAHKIQNCRRKNMHTLPQTT